MTSLWAEQVLSRIAEFDRHLRTTARQSEVPDIDHPATVSVEPFPRFPAVEFDYLAELDTTVPAPAASDAEVLNEIAGFFRGAQRPESPYCLFNLNVLPTVDATAAACLSVMHNVNGLMDAFAGESLLVEQKVARTIGQWAGWPSAMGISCNGGKLTMQYALRSAISRAQPTCAKEGIKGHIVVICSTGAHYSVEHVAASIGIGASNCIRVPVQSNGSMSPTALREALEDAHADGATVAAVVCCGGTVIDFCCDDTLEVRDVVDQFVKEHSLTNRPYLHFDGVIGWLYLAHRHVRPQALARLAVEDRTRKKLAEVVRRCSALEDFDSLGVDFHKTGLCPYSSSFFIARDRRFMDELGTGDYQYGSSDFQFGRFRAYRYTVENSRPMHGVLAAWVNLLRLGRQGFGDYLLSLHRARDQLLAALKRQGDFAVLNPDTLGWDVVIDIPFDLPTSALAYGDVAVAFMEHCWRRVREGHQLPLFSIVPEFHLSHDPSRSRFAFLIYPMRELPSATWDAVVAAIARERRRFEASEQLDNLLAQHPHWEKPIR
jgi:glutamate/tyrosine decarboxylase-like PLP-dependent enzyme